MSLCIKKWIVGILGAAALTVVMTAGTVLAGVQKPAAITVPVTVTVNNSSSPSEDYRITLTAENGAPLPADGVTEKTVRLGGSVTSGETSFSMSFEKVGEYRYVIGETAGSRSRITYDTGSYEVIVQVTNADEDSLRAVYVLNLAGQEEKPDSIVIENQYSRGGSGGGGGGGGSSGGGNGGNTTPSEEKGVLGALVDQIVESNPDSPIAQGVLSAERLVKTGDESLIAVFGLIFVIAAAGMVFWIIAWRRKRKA